MVLADLITNAITIAVTVIETASAVINGAK